MSGVDNSNRDYNWGAMESSVRSVRLLTLRDLAKSAPKRRVVQRKPVKRAKVKRGK